MIITSTHVNCTLNKNTNRKSACEVVGTASILFDGVFVVCNIRIIKNDRGNFVVAMPSRKRMDGTYSDLAYPVNSDFRKYIDESVLSKLNETMAVKQ